MQTNPVTPENEPSHNQKLLNLIQTNGLNEQTLEPVALYLEQLETLEDPQERENEIVDISAKFSNPVFIYETLGLTKNTTLDELDEKFVPLIIFLNSRGGVAEKMLKPALIRVQAALSEKISPTLDTQKPEDAQPLDKNGAQEHPFIRQSIDVFLGKFGANDAYRLSIPQVLKNEVLDLPDDYTQDQLNLAYNLFMKECTEKGITDENVLNQFKIGFSRLSKVARVPQYKPIHFEAKEPVEAQKPVEIQKPVKTQEPVEVKKPSLWERAKQTFSGLFGRKK
jgi:hypothetical protein